MLNEWNGKVWTESAWLRIRSSAAVMKIEMEIPVTYNAENLLINWVNFSVSKRVPLYGVSEFVG
jgi:hypothetical protein